MATQEAGKGHLQVEDPDAERAEWLGQLNALASQVRTWVEKAGWRTRLVSKPTKDGVLGRFEVPLLLMERDGVQIALNPVSRFVGTSEGAVDLYVVPAYDEVAGLSLEKDRWFIYYIFEQDESPGVLDAEAFLRAGPSANALSEELLIRVLDAMARRDP